MAEILRRLEDFDNAERYAKEAHKHGHRKAPLSLANIYFGQAQRVLSSGNRLVATDKFQDALNAISLFRPEYGDDQEVADTIAAKVYRTLGQPQRAKDLIGKYKNTENPYTIYEQCRVDLSEATQTHSVGQLGTALSLTQQAIDRINSYTLKHPLPQALRDVLEEAMELKSQIEAS
jgi:tetratricopeptide (TPR) repeat protein